MSACDQCAEEKEKLQVCSRCKSARYCSSSCQRAAWKLHKATCRPPAAAVPTAPLAPPIPQAASSCTIPAVLLGRGLKADKVLIPKPPFAISDVRHIFTEHAGSRDSDFIAMPMPFGQRLFHRDIHIIFDRAMLPGTGRASLSENNTFATRAAASLSTGFGPPIRKQALVFDPTGAPYLLGDFMVYDNVVFNTCMELYSDKWTQRPPTEVELDRLGTTCRRMYQNDRPQYADDGNMKGYGQYEEEIEF